MLDLLVIELEVKAFTGEWHIGVNDEFSRQPLIFVFIHIWCTSEVFCKGDFSPPREAMPSLCHQP